MEGRRALEAALDLAQMPTFGAVMRRQPLPPDTLAVIRIAAGCEETCREAAIATGKDPIAIKEACALYLQQVLFSSESDCYRVLGVSPSASKEEMRQHMHWLMRWLHPDRNQ